MSASDPRGEPRTDGGSATYTAVVEPQTNRYGEPVDTRVAEPTDALMEALGMVREGDTMTVEYRKGGMDLTERGEVTKVEPEDVDVWFSGAYLHVNVQTGDYYFQDSAPESPADGLEVTRIRVDARAD